MKANKCKITQTREKMVKAFKISSSIVITLTIEVYEILVENK